MRPAERSPINRNDWEAARDGSGVLQRSRAIRSERRHFYCLLRAGR